jgi:hypothetical protein
LFVVVVVLMLLPQGLTATGGVISDYTDGPAVYRAHVFTSSGTFTVTAPGALPGDTVEYLVVAGGGGGSSGGGGAGGYRTGTLNATTGGSPYTVTVGGGGAGATPNNDTDSFGFDGTDSVFGPITSNGGGGGGSLDRDGRTGGSGGGVRWWIH